MGKAVGEPYDSKRNPYDSEWQHRIDRIARSNSRPFNAWFQGKKRVYIPFEPLSGADEDIVEILQEANYIVVDYKKGLCSRPGSKTLQKIGRVLNRLKEEELAQVKADYESGLIFNFQREIRRRTKNWGIFISQFESSKYRGSKDNKMTVVISQDPHDIACMSTERNWESCMTLPTQEHHAGSNYKSLLKEVASGGFIAYLIKDHDLEIKKPLARLHIRRFIDATENSVAIPEASTYGLEVTGFLEVVQSWINSHQPPLAPGYYKLQGGSYSDTFSSKTMLIPPSDIGGLVRWFRGEGLDHIPYSVWTVTRDSSLDDEYDDYDQGEDHGDEDEPEERSFKTREQAERHANNANLNEDDSWRDHYIDEETGQRGHWAEIDKDGNYLHDPYEIEELIIDNRPDMQMVAAKALIKRPRGEVPIEIIQEIKDMTDQKVGYRIIEIKEALVLNYPELITSNDVDKFDRYFFAKFIKSLPDAEQQPYIRIMLDRLDTFLAHPSHIMPKCVVCHQYVDPDVDELVACPKDYLHHASCPKACGIMTFNEDEYHRGHRSETIETQRHHNLFYSKLTDLYDLFDPIQEFVRPIPEPLVGKLLNLPTRIPLLGVNRLMILERIIHLFSMTGTDTPRVQRFYYECLKYWNYEFGVGSLQYQVLGQSEAQSIRRRLQEKINSFSLGSAIARLGENGASFLPFLKSRLAQIQQDFGPQIVDPNFVCPYALYSENHRVWETATHIAERYLYIIDSIETGKGYSTKYQFNRSD